MENETYEAQQLIADFYGCDFSVINSEDKIKEIIYTACGFLDTEIMELCSHKFHPIGISAFAIISTSHFSIHTWPENQYAAVDIFSCKKGLTTKVCDVLYQMFGAKDVKTQMITRNIKEKR